MRLQFKVVGHCIAEYIRCLYAFDIITFARHFTHARIQEFSSGGGGPGQSDKKALTTFSSFFFSPRLI